MKPDIEAIINQLRDGTGCNECQYYGEPNGCNRPEGQCDAYDFGQEIADALDDMQEKITELEAERDALVGEIRRECNNCKHWRPLERPSCLSKEKECSWNHRKAWEWRGLCAKSTGKEQEMESKWLAAFKAGYKAAGGPVVPIG